MSDGLKDDGNGKTVFIQSLISSLIGVWLTTDWSTMLDESTNVSSKLANESFIVSLMILMDVIQAMKKYKINGFCYSVVYLTDRFYFFKFIFSWLFLGYIRYLYKLQQIFGCITALKYLYVKFTWILMVEQHWSANKCFRWPCRQAIA